MLPKCNVFFKKKIVIKNQSESKYLILAVTGWINCKFGMGPYYLVDGVLCCKQFW